MDKKFESVQCPMCGDWVDKLIQFGPHLICAECVNSYDILE